MTVGGQIEVGCDNIDAAQRAASIGHGSVGNVAKYAGSVTATYIIRRVMLRMNAWLNYLCLWVFRM